MKLSERAALLLGSKPAASDAINAENAISPLATIEPTDAINAKYAKRVPDGDGWQVCQCGRRYWAVAGHEVECYLCRKVRTGEPLLPFEERLATVQGSLATAD